jgi:signal transduction histidine kinase
MGHLAHTDPGTPIEKALEVVLYNLTGAVAGYLAQAERQRRAELRVALDEQQRLQKQLVRAGRLGALGEVVAGIAHEIRNPLHALRGTAEIVDPLVPQGTEERRMWEIHVSELERLDRVATRFLSFASPKPIEPAPLDLREVAERLVDLVGADARKKGARMVSELPPEAVTVRGDRDQLAQVALNIALNALRAVGPQRGTVRVSVRASVGSGPLDMAALVIENDGPPIPEQELEHLFDPFHGSADGGTGLGLSISERIVEQHGGFIEAANGGLGVTFSVLLPRA